jgi:hypothetical protein
MPKGSLKTRTARSKAALRGWSTRRKNAKKRSEAAFKGWRTRRRNERKREKEAGTEIVTIEIDRPKERVYHVTHKQLETPKKAKGKKAKKSSHRDQTGHSRSKRSNRASAKRRRT